MMSLQFGSLVILPKHFPKTTYNTFRKFEAVNRDPNTLEQADQTRYPWTKHNDNIRRQMSDVSKIVERVESNGFDVVVFSGPETRRSKYYIAFHSRDAEQREKDIEKRKQEGNIDRGETDAEALRKAAAEFDKRKREFKETKSVDIGRFNPAELDTVAPYTAMAYDYKSPRNINSNFADNIKDAWDGIGTRRFEFKELFWPGLEYLEMARQVEHIAEAGSPNKKMPSMVALLSQGSSANDLVILQTLYEQMCKVNPKNKDKIVIVHRDDEKDMEGLNKIIDETLRHEPYNLMDQTRARHYIKVIIDNMPYDM